MNQVIGSILSLRTEQLDNIIELSLITLILGAYLIPSIILIIDISKRYEDKVLRTILASLAILTLPLFIIPYLLFRKDTTIQEDFENKSEMDILSSSGNCTKCIKCSAINRENFNYCIKCGSLLTTTCKNCFHNIDLSWNHCAYCGNDLEFKENKQKINEKEQKIIKLTEKEIVVSTIKKNKKFLQAVGYKLNSLITVPAEIQ